MDSLNKLKNLLDTLGCHTKYVKFLHEGMRNTLSNVTTSERQGNILK